MSGGSSPDRCPDTGGVPELLKSKDVLSLPEYVDRVKRVASAAGVDINRVLSREFVVREVEAAERFTPSTAIRVLQWNVLAQGLCISSDGFCRCPDKALSWDERKYKLLHEIVCHRPDIICLQEVDQFEFFRQALCPLNYQGHFVEKIDSPALYGPHSIGPDGCAIFYKMNIFDLVSKKDLCLYNKHGCQTNQVALIFLLRHANDPDRHVVVVSTHLKAKAGWNELRLQQAKFLLNFLRQNYNSSYPIILCGDFNATPSEEVYQLMSVSHKFTSAYRAFDSEKSQEPDFTTWKIRLSSEIRCTIDYIWVTGNLHVTGCLKIPSEEEIGPDRLPGMHYPSDHIALSIQLQFE